MESVELGVDMMIVWFDVDVVELDVRASNGSYTATTRCYAGRRHFFVEAAALLRGFPASAGDRRELAFGALDPATTLGGVKMVFTCPRPTGWPSVEVVMKSGPEQDRAFAQFSFPVESAAIDDFVRSLQAVETRIGAQLRLRHAPD